VIDFEFSGWDVRAADFSRHPGWDWLDAPARLEAFCEGYGLQFNPEEEARQRVARVQYALGAVVWGMENSYFGFAAEGRRALQSFA
jgi:hypothetical protein